jgi:hypothetical protein
MMDCQGRRVRVVGQVLARGSSAGALVIGVILAWLLPSMHGAAAAVRAAGNPQGPQPAVTLTINPTQGDDYGAVSFHGNCGETRPSKTGPLHVIVALQDIAPGTKLNGQLPAIVADVGIFAGAYYAHDDGTFDGPNLVHTGLYAPPGNYQYAYAWCWAYIDGIEDVQHLWGYVGPSAGQPFCVTATYQNIRNCDVKDAPVWFGTGLGAGLATARGRILNAWHLPRPAGSSGTPNTPPSTRTRQTIPTTTSSSTSTTTTTTAGTGIRG